jgi:tRNA-dihydrouridine synthase B
MPDALILAPMQGITDHIFRNTHHKHFGAFHEMVAPYILAHGEKATRPTILKKLFNHNSVDYNLVPQLLGNNPSSLIVFANQMYNIGYDEVNWNLGCPYEFVTKKKRGSGLLPYPELIEEILNSIIPKIDSKLAVKIRLGLSNKDEIYKVLDILNLFPLKEIIIHPRTADQKYEGKVYLNEFEEYIKITNHQIVYNGDIYSKPDFEKFKNRFPQIYRWMIGRGVLINPLLPSYIRGSSSDNKEDRYIQFMSFYNDLFQQYRIKIKDDKRFLNRIKEIWSMQSQSYENPTSVFNILKNIHDVNKFEEEVNSLDVNKWLG